jgi:23S rRNA U2552 (ribose-2'-O)-methylase RlmE/FtsJ
MNDSAKDGSCKVEAYNYRDDFQLLTLKEKREILKNAKFLLKLQRDNGIWVTVAAGQQNENGAFV